jgi:hypothetical protein
MSVCELQAEVAQLYTTVKQLTITADKLQTDISNITKSYDTIMLSHAQLQTQINYFATLVTGQNEVDQRSARRSTWGERPKTPESPRSPPSLVSDEDKCGSVVAWSV